MVKKAKKRGVKPGTKRGTYKKHNLTTISGKPITLAEMDLAMNYIPPSVGNLPSLISELTSTIDSLEAQLTAQIDRIKSILR